MRLRNIPGAKDAVKADPRCYDTGDPVKGEWKKIFNKEAPLIAEVGMGKGRFILDMAEKYPDSCFIGVERYESVMIKALEKLDRRIKNGEEVPQNVRFLRADALDMTDFFNEGELDRIYLNFSDPWPKDRHAKRRLVSRRFLAVFEKVLKDSGTIEFKTDNRDLFDFGLSELEPAGWELLYSTCDLHSDAEAMKDNVMTEYEEKFSAKGNKICKFIIRKK
ncbi:MAG: tRNA (guanosine(46)-N7)-methyltransferase TrmB [Lachnospiraceae bacterium]|nr:tRNA (guanosine(46)-N7)-methyltransferase TrmB [Lachnospiraceae bacterium]